MERRLLFRRLRSDIDVELSWEALLEAGNTAMTELQRGHDARELGFMMVGSLIPGERGRTRAAITKLVPLGRGSANAFTVSPELARSINTYRYRPGERTLGLAHTHLPHHLDGPSTQDIEYARNYVSTMVSVVLKVNRDGGGKLSIHDGDGHVDYTLKSANGYAQHFPADRSGVINTERLSAPARHQAA